MEAPVKYQFWMIANLSTRVSEILYWCCNLGPDCIFGRDRFFVGRDSPKRLFPHSFFILYSVVPSNFCDFKTPQGRRFQNAPRTESAPRMDSKMPQGRKVPQGRLCCSEGVSVCHKRCFRVSWRRGTRWSCQFPTGTTISSRFQNAPRPTFSNFCQNFVQTPKNSRKIFQSVTSSPGAKLRSPEVCLDGIFERPRSKITSVERSRILLRILQILRARTKF